MYLLRKQILRVVLLAVLFLAIISLGCEYQNDAASEIPIEGAVYHVHRPDGTHKTYLDVVVGRAFSGKLPDDIDSITVTGPNGDLSIGKDDFNYNPQWRAFWIVLPGFPQIGKYTFKLASGNSSGFATDTQSLVKTIPIPDISKFKPPMAETDSCLTPTFSWSLINEPNALYYQLQIRDLNRKHVYRTNYVRDMFSIRIPLDILKPRMTYQWRIRVADGPDWKALNNRSQSRWVKFSVNQSIAPCKHIYKIPAKTDDGWETSSLIKEGVNPEYLNQLMVDIFDGKYKDIHSIVIARNGKLIFEEYFSGNHRNSLHVMASATKSVTSILVGIALDKKMITNVNRKIYELLPQYEGTNWIEKKYEITLEHLLTMTAGVDWLASTSGIPLSDPRNDDAGLYRSYDPIKYTLEKELIEQPGSRYNYSTGVSTVLGEILKKASGLNPDKFAAKYLFYPLGIQNYKWKAYPNGTIDTGGGLYLRSRDMAKIGYMMLKKGKWRGNQIVSEEWVNESTKAQVQKIGNATMASDYGYQWHHGEIKIRDRSIEAFFAQGLGGQYIFIIPSMNMVVVFTYQHPESSGWMDGNLLLTKYIIPSVLPPAPLHKTTELNSRIIDKYIGKYELKRFNEQFIVGKQHGNLYIQKPGDPKVMLYPETETTFYGTYEKIGKIQITFAVDKQRNIKHMVMRIGFLSIQLEKTN